MASKFRTIGFDINPRRIEELSAGNDRTGEVAGEELRDAKIEFTTSIDVLRQADFFIVAVPTPVDDAKQPDLTPLYKASETVGKALKKGDVVVYESTVYPGATEEDCAPILEKFSGLVCGKDFKIGYSPERINPADKEHRFRTIKKVVSAQDAESLAVVAHVYGSVVDAGIHQAPSIKVAEAAKVIENTQRDLNIALMNELAIVFDRMGIDTHAVLAAAGTKWNFLRFTPGLVGGHCIGVDPYYLTHKAERMGYTPQVILGGRRINDGMGKFIAEKTIQSMILSGQKVLGAKVTILGLTFKENCPDTRNTRVVDIVAALKDFGATIQICDPEADADEAKHEYGISLTPWNELEKSGTIVAAVAHDAFKKKSLADLRGILAPDVATPVVIDVKDVFGKLALAEHGFRYWRL
jgi:UDP-N-acetyl-D-galactosamine dehydrogenase